MDRLFCLFLLIGAQSASAGLSGPTTDDDGTYDLTWTNTCTQGVDSHNLYENGQLILGPTCDQSVSIIGNAPGIYDYVLEQCGTVVIEGFPEFLCVDVDTHTVTVIDDGGDPGGSGGTGNCSLDVSPPAWAGTATYLRTGGSTSATLIAIFGPTQGWHAEDGNGDGCPITLIQHFTFYPFGHFIVHSFLSNDATALGFAYVFIDLDNIPSWCPFPTGVCLIPGEVSMTAGIPPQTPTAFVSPWVFTLIVF